MKKLVPTALLVLVAALLVPSFASAGFEKTRKVGWGPRTSKAAAKLVDRSKFEPRPQNRKSNHRVPGKNLLRSWRKRSEMPYKEYVNGRFRGTTDEIIQWAACKHGFDVNLARAQAVVESFWRQNDTFGDFGSDPAACLPGHPIGADGRPGECPQSIGLLQVRYPFHQAAFENNNAIRSTAYNADHAWGQWRRCFEGDPVYSWLNTVERGREYVAGDAIGCMGVWFAGRWYTPDAVMYMDRIRAELN